MVTSLELKEADTTPQTTRKSEIKQENVDGIETFIYCPLCVDQNLKSKLRALAKTPENEVIDITCEDCIAEMNELQGKDELPENKKDRYTKRDSYRIIMTIRGHRNNFHSRMGYVVMSRSDTNNNPSNAESS